MRPLTVYPHSSLISLSDADGAVLSAVGLLDQWKEPETGEFSSYILIITAAKEQKEIARSYFHR